jgi:hypothetical protein
VRRTLCLDRAGLPSGIRLAGRHTAAADVNRHLTRLTPPKYGSQFRATSVTRRHAVMIFNLVLRITNEATAQRSQNESSRMITFTESMV